MNTFTPERVTLELTRDEFHDLMMALTSCRHVAHDRLRLVNAINRGNPDWTPYEVPEAKT